MKRNLTFLLIIIGINLSFINLRAENDSLRVRKADSIYIFKPSTPLTPYKPDDITITGAQGLELVFSNSGIGLGYFYHYFLNNTNILFGSFFVSGARNSDEFEYWNSNTGQTFVPGKINRLFLIPFTFGFTKILFNNSIAGSFRPFTSVGAGPSLILSTPYEIEWFKAWSSHKSYLRFGGFIQIGAYFRAIGKSVSTIGLKYYYIPFGGKGLESIEDSPIKDFGGIFLTLDVGIGF